MWDFGRLTSGLLGQAMYLDTNVWSELAKGHLDPQWIRFLLNSRATYLILGPIQVLELSRRPDLAVGPRRVVRPASRLFRGTFRGLRTRRQPCLESRL